MILIVKILKNGIPHYYDPFNIAIFNPES